MPSAANLVVGTWYLVGVGRPVYARRTPGVFTETTCCAPPPPQTYSQVELVDALGHFMGADPGHITAAFDRLQREGVVVADAARLDTFRPAAAAGAKVRAQAGGRAEPGEGLE